MKKSRIIRLGFLILFFSCFLYYYLDKQNELTYLRIKIPEIQREIGAIQEENKRFQYEIDQFEHPSHLMQLARSIEFAHLKHPLVQEILSLKEGVAVICEEKEDTESMRKKYIPFAVGAK